ncbi:MAG: tetratricopeptide repeat protein [Pseudomonadota bacterium]
MTRLLCLLLSLNLLASPAAAHRAHDHATELASVERWRVRLLQFQEHGHGADLAAALAMAEELGSGTVEQKLLTAQTLQADHQFDAAIGTLRELLRGQPQHAGAHLLLANALIVSGHPVQARPVCAALATAVAVLVAQACSLQTYLLDSCGLPRRYQRLRALAEFELDSLDASLRAWVLGLLGDAASVLGRDDEALAQYRQAHAVHPQLRYHSAMAEVLLRRGRFDEVLELAVGYPEHLGMRVKVLIAARALGALASYGDLHRSLGSELRADLAAGDFGHGRELAEYLLYVEDEPATAREVVERYLDVQREFEDLRLLEVARRRLGG